MNYLAHIYLSGDDSLLRIGNFIADSVKGKKYLNELPARVADGITLHRKIDVFTDDHPTVMQSKNLIRHNYGLWSGVIVDMYYDHFLAANWSNYHNQSLPVFADDFYNDLIANKEFLPEKVQGFMHQMIQHNWLNSYATITGIAVIFNQMNNRTKNKSNMNFATEDLTLHYNVLKNHFTIFFDDLQLFVKQELGAI